MEQRNLDRFLAATAFDSSHEKIGRVGQVYLDDQTSQPTWVSISTGLFGSSQSFAPLKGHRIDGADLVLAYDRSVVKDAPRVDADEHITPSEEEELYAYYRGHGYDDTSQRGWATDDRSADADNRPVTDRDGDHRVDRDDESARVTASEERLRVGRETTETGSASLRKYTTTEEQTVSVPVTKEKVVVERNDLGGRPSRSSLGHDDSEVVEAIVTREERPVVSKETVDVEEVTLGKERATEDVTVTERVAKEHIDVDGDTAGGRSAR